MHETEVVCPTCKSPVEAKGAQVQCPRCNSWIELPSCSGVCGGCSLAKGGGHEDMSRPGKAEAVSGPFASIKSWLRRISSSGKGCSE